MSYSVKGTANWITIENEMLSKALEYKRRNRTQIVTNEQF